MHRFLIAIVILSIPAQLGCQSGSQAAAKVATPAVTKAPAQLSTSTAQETPETAKPVGPVAPADQDPRLVLAAREFNGGRAFNHLVAQCNFGPRIPGMPGHRKTRDYIVNHMKAQGFTVELQKFNKYSAIMKKTLAFENIIARLDTPSTQTVVMSCHWDTRPIADRDLNPANRKTPILGANDAGSGVAVLLELAANYKKHEPPTDLIFLFFDAEDYGGLGFDEQWCMGSQYMADHPPKDFEFVVGVNLDMVGEREQGESTQVFYIEPNSLTTAKKWTNDIWTVGSALYPRNFTFVKTTAIIDDHLPFVEKGLPFLDIIDLEYPAWHTLGDLPNQCSAESLNRIGKTMTQWLFTHFKN